MTSRIIHEWGTCTDAIRRIRSRSYKYQVQASDQFLETTKLATNKAICLKTKTKTINKSKMYSYSFLATNNKYLTLNAYSTQWIDIWTYMTYFWSPSPPHNAKLTFVTLLWTWCEKSHTDTQRSKRPARYILRSISNVSPEHNIFFFFNTGINNEDTNIFGMARLQKSPPTLNKYRLNK